MRIIFLSFFFFIQVALWANQIWAVSPQTEFMRTFQSDKIQFPSEDSEFAQSVPGRFPPLLHWALQDVLRWTPTGQPSFFSPECQWSRWQSRFDVENVQRRAEQIQKFIRQCGTEIESGITNSTLLSLKSLGLFLDLDHHPFLHRVVFRLPSGQVLKGRLALKGDLKKRPLVIVRLGVCSNTEEFFPERYVLMMLFEQSPYNVLILENSTAADSIFFNKRKFFGGYDEGLQNIWVAKTLSDPNEPISQIISTMHMVAISLGGHGMFYSSLLNQFNKDSNGEKLIQNFLGLCPVVNLKERFADLSSPGFKGIFVDFWMRRRLSAFQQLGESYRSWDLWDRFMLHPTYLPRVIEKVEQDFDSHLAQKLDVKTPEQRPTESFWQAQDFWPVYENINSPVMTWGTQKDDLVPWNENAGSLHKKNVGQVLFPQGFHCTLPAAYDWSTVGHLLDQNIRVYTQGMKLKREFVTIELSRAYSSDSQSWMIESVDWNTPEPHMININLRNRNFKNLLVHTMISRDSLDFHFRNSELSKAEKEMITRWIYQNIEIQNKNKKLFLTWARLD